jgi:Tol biopolymer transport system component
MGANFDLWKMDLKFEEGKVSGGEPVRITDHEKADVLPVFSPDGKKLMWTSNRTADGTSQLWVADWNE